MNKPIPAEAIASVTNQSSFLKFLSDRLGWKIEEGYSIADLTYEWFQYSRAQLLTGTALDIISGQLFAGNVLFDLRMDAQPTKSELRYLVEGNWLQWSFKNCVEI